MYDYSKLAMHRGLASTSALLKALASSAYYFPPSFSYADMLLILLFLCSDGVGRSGTYVLLDMVLNRISKGSKEIDIAATLEHIRDQRSGKFISK